MSCYRRSNSLFPTLRGNTISCMGLIGRSHSALGFLVLGFTMLCASADAQVPHQQFKIALHLAAAEDVKSQTMSFLLREFRSIGDVDLTVVPLQGVADIDTTNQVDFELRVLLIHCDEYILVAMPLNYDAADLLHSSLKKSSASDRLQENPLSLYNIARIAEMKIRNKGLLEYYFVVHGNDLKEQCQACVARFDSEFLQPIRDAYKRINQK